MTKNLTKREVLLAVVDATPKNVFPHEVDYDLTTACDENLTTENYLFARIDRQYIIVNLGTGLMFSWFGDYLGDYAWVNRPFFTHRQLVEFFKDVCKEFPQLS